MKMANCVIEFNQYEDSANSPSAIALMICCPSYLGEICYHIALKKIHNVTFGIKNLVQAYRTFENFDNCYLT